MPMMNCFCPVLSIMICPNPFCRERENAANAIMDSLAETSAASRARGRSVLGCIRDDGEGGQQKNDDEDGSACAQRDILHGLHLLFQSAVGDHAISEVRQTVDMVYAAEFVDGQNNHHGHQVGGQGQSRDVGCRADECAKCQADHREDINMLHEGLDTLHGYAHRYGRQPAESRLKRKEQVFQSNTALVYMFAETPPMSPATTSSMNGPRRESIPGLALS